MEWNGSFPDPSSSSSMSCLVVDANERTLSLFGSWLQQLPVTLVFERSSDIAQHRLSSQPFNIIFVDLDCQWQHNRIQTPIQLVSFIKTQSMNRPTPLIGLTTNRNLTSNVLQDVGFNHILYKPYNKETIVQILDTFRPRTSTQFDLELPVLSLADLGTDVGQEDLTSQPNVLVVEDDDLTMKVMCSMLGELDANIAKASDGMQAVEMCKSNHFDMIFMDINLPSMNGVEATRQIRAAQDNLNSVTPIIAFTSNDIPVDYEKYNMNDYLKKPFTAEKLKELFDRWTPFGLRLRQSFSLPSHQTPPVSTQQSTASIPLQPESPGIPGSPHSELQSFDLMSQHQQFRRTNSSSAVERIRRSSSPVVSNFSTLRLSSTPPPQGSQMQSFEPRPRSESTPNLYMNPNQMPQQFSQQVLGSSLGQQTAFGYQQDMPPLLHTRSPSHSVHSQRQRTTTADAASGTFKSGKKKKQGNSSDHTEKERQRRAAISASCDKFRDLVPGLRSADKATVFGFSVMYLSFLKARVPPEQLLQIDEEFFKTVKDHPEAHRLDFSRSPVSSNPGSPRLGRPSDGHRMTAQRYASRDSLSPVRMRPNPPSSPSPAHSPLAQHNLSS